MINISNISLQYGGRYLFDDISFTVTPLDRIGLVGKNGAGKSTLLKILTGELKGESGTIAMDNDISLGYLPQEVTLRPVKSVFEEAATAFSEVKNLQKSLQKIQKEVAERTDYESDSYLKLLHQLSDTQDRLQRLGAYQIREQVEKILKGLGFINGDFDRPLKEFSGGWQMRVELAKILLRQPNYILLDEPTNHLDIESIMWLEDFLSNYNGCVIIISHDKAFLDNVTNRTVEIVNGKVYDHKTSYSQFLDLREQRIEQQSIEAKRQEKYIEHTEQLINKFRAKKNKAKFAQTLITKLDRLEKVEVDDKESGAIKFRFPEAPRSGRAVVKVERMTKKYGDYTVLNDIDFLLERGDKIAFVGKNGEGKTTLTKIINGQTDYTGICELGHNVSIGYYEQHQTENLDGDKTVFQTIDDIASGEMRYKVRGLLGAFLFSGEDVDKKVKVLSGGEKSRLALAKMLLEPVNLLILDEPTNHLDIRSKGVLKQALQHYNGSLIVVSHDREFLKDLTQKVYEFKNKKIKQYLGDVYDFLKERDIKTLDELGMKNRQASSRQVEQNHQKTLSKEERIARREEIKALEKEMRKVNNKVSKCEKNISGLEEKIAELEGIMNATDFYFSYENPQSVIEQHTKAKKDLETEMENWELFGIELEELKEKREAFEQ